MNRQQGVDVGRKGRTSALLLAMVAGAGVVVVVSSRYGGDVREVNPEQAIEIAQSLAFTAVGGVQSPPSAKIIEVQVVEGARSCQGVLKFYPDGRRELVLNVPTETGTAPRYLTGDLSSAARKKYPPFRNCYP